MRATLLIPALLIIAAAGCNRSSGVSASTASAAVPARSGARAPAAPAVALPAAQLAALHVNEAGMVPILEYHAIGPGRSQFDRSVAAFKADLERLYAEGYRPVLLHDYLNNRIAVPAGKTPVVLTFDDARESQFRYRPDGSLDPDCAVAILKSFQSAHPDFITKSTFYVLPQSAFGPHASAAKKMQELVGMGYEIGNHTVTHNSLRKMTDEQVQKELAQAVVLEHQLAPSAQIDTVALPMGIAPRNRALLAAGEYQGNRYANRAVLLVGANPAPSPVSKAFKPMRLPRIQACEGLMGITYWLDEMKRHPKLRYISDGDPGTVTVPASRAGAVDESKLQGARLRTY